MKGYEESLKDTSFLFPLSSFLFSLLKMEGAGGLLEVLGEFTFTHFHDNVEELLYDGEVDDGHSEPLPSILPSTHGAVPAEGRTIPRGIICIHA